MTMSDVSVIPVCTYTRARDVDMQTSVTSDMVPPYGPIGSNPGQIGPNTQTPQNILRTRTDVL
jgi:hypothetical protein